MTIDEILNPYKRYNLSPTGDSIGEFIRANDQELIGLFMDWWNKRIGIIPDDYDTIELALFKLFTYEDYLNWHNGKPQKLLDIISGVILGFRGKFDTTHRGYCQAILYIAKKHNPKVAEFFNKPLAVNIPIANRKRHGYIVGKSGGGKSTVVKGLARCDILRKDGSVIVIDPKGDLADEIAHFREFSLKSPHYNRLRYINPVLYGDIVPVINIFDQLDNINKAAPAIRDTFVNIFKEMGNSADFTGAMESMLYHFIWVACENKLNLIDIYRLADPGVRVKDKRVETPKNERLVDMGKKSSNPMTADYFNNKFDQANHTTKQGIEWRIGALLQDPFLQKMTHGKSTIKLKDWLDNNMVIVVNLGKGQIGASTSILLGKIIISFLQVIAQDRNELPANKRPHTWAFVDEMHNYTTKSNMSIFAEGRSGGLAFCGAQQVTMQGMDKDFYRIMMANTDFKIVSQSTVENWDDMKKQLGIKEEVLMEQEIYTYWLKVGNGKAVLISDADKLVIDDNNSMTDDEWKVVLENQKQYYREPEPLFEIKDNLSPLNFD